MSVQRLWVTLVAALCCLPTTGAAQDSRAADVSNRMTTQARTLLRRFYTALLGSGPASECPDLFTQMDMDELERLLPEKEKQELGTGDARTRAWLYLRRHKQLYLAGGVWDTVEAWKPAEDHFLPLRFVTLDLGVADDSREYPYLSLWVTVLGAIKVPAQGEPPGVIKEVHFTLGRRTTSAPFDRIAFPAEVAAIVFPDVAGEYKRPRDLYESLGVW
jgi:hypothetical protein